VVLEISHAAGADRVDRGIIFFAFVLAPTLFSVLPTTKLAGDVVNATLGKLHWMGLVSGVVVLISSLLYNWQKDVQLRPFALSHVFVGLMFIFTAYSQFRITPRMRELRAEMQNAANMSPSEGSRLNSIVCTYGRHGWKAAFSCWALVL